MNVVLTTNANPTSNGKVSWLLTPKGYQHLELLLPVHSKFKASFWAKSESPVTVVLKIIGAGEDGKPKGIPIEFVKAPACIGRNHTGTGLAPLIRGFIALSFMVTPLPACVYW